MSNDQYQSPSCLVTPLAGVWIEIYITSWKRSAFSCHSPCGSVDWNVYCLAVVLHVPLSLPLRECGLKYHCCLNIISDDRHSPCGSVDWNLCSLLHLSLAFSHSPCGSVDWNTVHIIINAHIKVTPLAGVWIEITKQDVWVRQPPSLPLRECGLK